MVSNEVIKALQDVAFSAEMIDLYGASIERLSDLRTSLTALYDAKGKAYDKFSIAVYDSKSLKDSYYGS